MKAHPLKEEEVYAHCGIQKQRRQKHIQEEFVRLYPQPPGDGVPQPPQSSVRREHEGLKHPACDQNISHCHCPM